MEKVSKQKTKVVKNGNLHSFYVSVPFFLSFGVSLCLSFICLFYSQSNPYNGKITIRSTERFKKIEQESKNEIEKIETIMEWKINGIVWFHRFSDTTFKIYTNPLLLCIRFFHLNFLVKIGYSV